MVEQGIFRFQQPEVLYALLGVPLLLVVFWLSRWWQQKKIKKYGDPHLVEGLMPERSLSRQAWKFSLVLLAWISGVFALARPQFGSKLEEVKRKGVEIMIALDVSNSMLAQDIEPSRLERAKQAISRLVDQLEDDKVGLIVFAGDAYIQVPITDDYLAVKMFLSGVGPEIVPRQGTAIGQAIDLAMKSFSPVSDAGKAIIIITDGENHEGDPVGAAEKAAEIGIVVHTLGMGLERGAPIPIDPGAQVKTYRKDREGNVVISKLDEALLSRVAVAGKGKYVRANNIRVGLDVLMEEIRGMEQAEMEMRMFSEYDERFQYLAGLSLFLLLLDFVILERKNRWLSKIRLYEEKN